MHSSQPLSVGTPSFLFIFLIIVQKKGNVNDFFVYTIPFFTLSHKKNSSQAK